MATSSGVFFLRKPPTPQYMSSVFSRTTTKSMSSGPLPVSGVSTPGKSLHRPQVDVLVELKAQLQQQALFQDARGDVGMADRAQERSASNFRSSSTAPAGRISPVRR